MENSKDMILIKEKSIHELVETLEFLKTTIKKDIKPIAEKIGEAQNVALTFKKLDFTLHNFNHDIAAKLKMGSLQEVVVILNEVKAKVERLGFGLGDQYRLLLEMHQKELLKIIDENIRISQSFQKEVSEIISDRFREVSVANIEKTIETEIKRRLGNFRFEEMQSMIQVSKMEEHLRRRIKIYDNYLIKMKQHSEKMKKMIEWNTELTAIIQIKYIVGALGLGIVVGYTKFFYIFG